MKRVLVIFGLLISCLILSLVGWFFASNLLIYLLGFVLIFILWKKYRLGSFFILLTLAFIFITGFEENFCDQKGHKIAKGSPEQFVPVSEDKFAVYIQEKFKLGDKINVAFLEHMRCHENFSLF